MPGPDGPHPSAVSGAFGLPFAEQVAFFRRKLGNLVPTSAWDDLDRAAHDQAFMVAGAAKADLLADLAAAVDKAIAEGRGIDTFRKDFRDIVRRNGWTGWTGEGSVKGEAWRVGVIYRTNSYTSYAAGRLAQLQAGDFPFWVYRHGGSLEPRLVHLGWNGLVLPPSHPFWRTHYPPSDWGCNCYVVGARSEAAARRLGGDPAKKLPTDWNATDPRTGAPIGIGKGWDYAPGASVSAIIPQMASKIRNWEYGTAKAFMAGLPKETVDALSSSYRKLPSTADDAQRLARSVFETGVRPDNPQMATLGMVNRDQQADIAKQIGKTVDGFDFRLTDEAIAHVKNAHSDLAIEMSRRQRPVTADDFAHLPLVLEDPDRIERAANSKQGQTLIHYVKQIGSETYTAVMVVSRSWKTLTLKTYYVGI